MKLHLGSRPEVARLAQDLGLGSADALSAILAYCDRQMDSLIGRFQGCETLAALLEISAQACP
jgi:hypothetical protein